MKKPSEQSMIEILDNVANARADRRFVNKERAKLKEAASNLRVQEHDAKQTFIRAACEEFVEKVVSDPEAYIFQWADRPNSSCTLTRFVRTPRHLTDGYNRAVAEYNSAGMRLREELVKAFEKNPERATKFFVDSATLVTPKDC